MTIQFIVAEDSNLGIKLVSRKCGGIRETFDLVKLQFN